MTGPIPRKKLAEWLDFLEQLAASRGFTCSRWGFTDQFPLLAFSRDARQQDGKTTPRVYLSAGIHGDEPAGPLAIECLLREDRLDPEISWTVCPALNPAGWAAGTRETPAGVDLNRDYLSRRSIEAQAHCAWIDHMPRPDLYLSLHEDWEATGFYLYEINTSGYPSVARQILEAAATVLPIEPLPQIDNHAVAAPGYISHSPEPDEPGNWPEAIYHCKIYPHLSYTFETPSSAPMEKRIAAQIAAVEAAVRAFREDRSADSR